MSSITGMERVGLLAASLLEQIEADALPEGISNPRIGTVALVVEIEADQESNEHGATRIVYRCTDSREWVQAGLFLAASDAARRWGEVGDEDDED